jgi:hypothetical protein
VDRVSAPPCDGGSPVQGAEEDIRLMARFDRPGDRDSRSCGAAVTAGTREGTRTMSNCSVLHNEQVSSRSGRGPCRDVAHINGAEPLTASARSTAHSYEACGRLPVGAWACAFFRRRFV